MAIRHGLLLLLAAGHFFLVICGACGRLPDGHRLPYAMPLLWYARMTGADSQHSFYAPEVGTNYRALFTLKDSEDMTWSDSFDEGGSPEARLRLSGIATCGFANGAAEEIPERRLRLVKSWAATMFSRHPNAVSHTVVVEAFEVPTMFEYLQNDRPKWVVVYQAQVQRHSAATQDGGAP